MLERGSISTLALAAAVAACSSSSGTTATSDRTAPGCRVEADCAQSADTPLCDVSRKACVALPQGHEIGYRDGTPESVAFTEIYQASASAGLIDLEFDPDHDGELWAVGYGDDSTHVGMGIGTDAPSWRRFVDPAAMHFMHKPPALAMGGGLRWGTCGDNDNRGNGADLFMGPALFETDLTVFAKATPGGLGSHTDMLHNTPFCRGIAHEKALVYWVFNSFDNSIDKYDFGKEHAPGGDDHSAGSIYRYVPGQVKGKEGTSSHLFFDANDGFLYIADTGNQRVARLDTSAGTKGESLPRQMEPLRDDAVMKGTTLEEVVPSGALTAPSGLEIHGELLYVTDADTSTFHVFDKSGTELRTLDTGLPAGSLSGFTFGPDGKIYFTDRLTSRVLRIDPQ